LAISISTLAAGLAIAQSASSPATAPSTQPKNPYNFRDNVKVTLTDKFIVVKSDGIPDHTTGDFPNRTNPNKILKQDYTFNIPLKPVKSDKITKLPMGPIGVAINGIPFYNPYNAQGADAALNEVFDECCGHPDPMGRYHYHIYPTCIHTSFTDKPGEHSPIIGYAFDGYAIYGPLGEDGKEPKDLDECNGHTDSIRGYHYHVTAKFPYILGGYHGVVEASNLDSGPRDDQGRPLGGPPGGGPGRGPRGGPGGPGGPGRGDPLGRGPGRGPGGPGRGPGSPPPPAGG
jgi:hypothetical protein